MDCYSCEQPAINACKRCAKPYCEEHGNATYCADCLRPSSALPSFNLYRGALLTLLIGTAVAVYLILRPPGEPNSAPPVAVSKVTPTAASGTPQPTVAAQTPQVTPSETAGTPETGTATAGASTTGTPTAGTPTPSGTESPFLIHVVVEGDSLFGIAQANMPPGDDVMAYARAIASLNGIDFNSPNLRIGQKLALPPKPPAR